MGRDNLKYVYRNRRPDYYAIVANHFTPIWLEKDLFGEEIFVTSFLKILGENGYELASTRRHKITSHKGKFLFRKGRARVYPSDLRVFPHYFWDRENNSYNLTAILERYKNICKT